MDITPESKIKAFLNGRSKAAERIAELDRSLLEGAESLLSFKEDELKTIREIIEFLSTWENTENELRYFQAQETELEKSITSDRTFSIPFYKEARDKAFAELSEINALIEGIDAKFPADN